MGRKELPVYKGAERKLLEADRLIRQDIADNLTVRKDGKGNVYLAVARADIASALEAIQDYEEATHDTVA